MNQTFSSPEEEIQYLRSQITQKMEKAKSFETRFTQKDRAYEVLRDYKDSSPEETLSPYTQITAGEEHTLLAWLAPKNTDEQV